MALRQRGERQPAQDLILSIPLWVPALRVRAFVWTVCFLSATGLAVYAVLQTVLGIEWLKYLLLSIVAVVLILSSAPLFRVVAVWRDRKWFEKRWNCAVQLVESIGSRSRIDDIEVGAWVCLEKDYRDEKRRMGERGYTMPVNYRCLVASIRLNGNEQILSFSDGSVTRCNPRAPAYWLSRRPVGFIGQHDPEAVDSSAAALERLVQRLDSEIGGRISLFDGLDRFEVHYGVDSVRHAVRTAVWWGFVEPDGSDSCLQITDAGRVWAEAEPARLANLEKVALVKDRRRSEPTFSIGSNYGIINVAKTIKGDSVVVAAGPSDRDLLGALRDVLDVSEVPWDSAELADVRQEIESAVADGEPHRPGLKTAVPKLLRVCRDLAIGVSGSAIFEVLKAHFG